MAPRYVDYKALKTAVRMMDVLAWLKIELTPEGQTLRGTCPLCNYDDDRIFVATPSKHLWYCHKEEAGGDTIALVARAHGISTREAAATMADHFGFGKGNSERSTSSPSTVTVPSTKPAVPPATDGLQPLAHLTNDHPAIEMLGLTAQVCDALGIGYAPKGLMRARVVFPLRLPDGTLTGYMGLATTGDQAPLILFPKNLDQRLTAPAPAEKPKQPADELRKLFRVVA